MDKITFVRKLKDELLKQIGFEGGELVEPPPHLARFDPEWFDMVVDGLYKIVDYYNSVKGHLRAVLEEIHKFHAGLEVKDYNTRHAHAFIDEYTWEDLQEIVRRVAEGEISFKVDEVYANMAKRVLQHWQEFPQEEAEREIREEKEKIRQERGKIL